MAFVIDRDDSHSEWVLIQLDYLSERLGTSRFYRRLHAVADWLRLILETPGELFNTGFDFKAHASLFTPAGAYIN